MNYRSWCILVAAVLGTLATTKCASLDDAALRLKDLTSSGGLAALDSSNGATQHAARKEFRNYTSDNREMICRPLEGGGFELALIIVFRFENNPKATEPADSSTGYILNGATADKSYESEKKE
ncbi:hypothetical protein IscW_ISCW013605 [Ixodes scapularis]|uniref:Uncharacterized protein n=1 Tax=Ixodes scapularis TaxID=6945 RepID=B7QGK7_IXOSC|nr:hypothetical protein IscW_ISCW013605 [Ixodes scapularis]|eukprot:XP_002399831.1 hypothetical protein IscW_ISCW013605 [Ixodes scapularis]